MIYRSLLVVSFVWLLGQPISYSQAQIEVSGLQESTIGPIPVVNWIFHADVCEGYVGTISNDGELFQLHGVDGATVFARKAQADERATYLQVSMRDNPSMVLLIEGWGSNLFECIVLDYAGNLLAGPVRSENIVAVSPGGRYFYSVNDIGNSNATPSVYDRTGRRLARFKSASSAWDIQAINDSLLLHREADRVRVIAVPEMVVQSELMTPSGIPSDLQSSALSRNGFWYAYPQLETVIVCDLAAKASYFIPKEVINGFHVLPELVVSSDGSFLVMFVKTSRGNEVAVYRREGKSYRKLAHNHDIASGHNRNVMGGWFVDASICALNLFSSGNQGINFFSYVFDAAIASDDLNGVFMEGLVTQELSASNGTPRVRITGLYGQKAVTKIVQLKGRDHE